MPESAPLAPHQQPTLAPSQQAPPEITRRGFLRLAGTVAAGAALSACGLRSATPTPGQGQKVQLVYQDWRTEWFPAMAQEMLAEFHATHPNIRVFYVPDPEDLEDRMLSEMQSGTAADVFQGCCAHFPIWAQKGYTLDLRPYVAADLDASIINDWDAAQYHSFFTRDGHQYGLPKYHGALALYYNKDLFDRYGVDYPDASWSLNDYQGAMSRLTHDRDGDGQTDLWGSMLDVSWERIQVHVNAWGGHLVDPNDPTCCLMAAPEALDAVSWLRARMWDDGVMATLPAVQESGIAEAFLAGKTAMLEDGSWALKTILSRADFRVGVAPMPAGPARRVTLATTDGFGIYAGTRHPDAAWELVRFLISKQYGRAMARANLLQPARASLVDEWVGFVRDEFPAQAKEMDLAAFADGHLKGYSVVAEIFPNMDEARRLAYAAWDDILTLGRAPVDTLFGVCREIEGAQSEAVDGGGPCC